jgi:lysyl-tRNA synthetase class 1
MSSSKGVGITAREMATLVPADVLRFLMVRTPPNRPVDFPPVREKIVRLYSDFDRTRARAATQEPGGLDRELLAISQTRPEPDYFVPPFDLVLAMAQLPHVDPVRETERLKGAPLTPQDLNHLSRRMESARYWLKNYAASDERFELSDRLAEVGPRLGVLQREFLHLVAGELPSVTWSPEALQALLFDAARLTPVAQPAAFGAVYLVLSGQEWGPRAGNLLAFLDRDFVLARFTAVDRPLPTQVWAESATDEAAVADWLGSIADSVARVEVRPLVCATEPPAATDDAAARTPGRGVVEALVELADGRRHVRRCRLTTIERDGPLRLKDGAPVEAAASEFAATVRTRVGGEVEVVVADLAVCEPTPVAAARS